MSKKDISLIMVVLLSMLTAALFAEDVFYEDFERSDYGNWVTTGTAFGKGPTKGHFRGQQRINGFFGRRLVNSFLDGDKAMGSLTSPEFTVAHKYVHFLIGGGKYSEKTCVNLIVDGAVMRTATGTNDEQVNWARWDVTDLLGKKAKIQIVDAHSGPFGHVNVDHIVFSNGEESITEVHRQMRIDKRYLVWPVRRLPRQSRPSGRFFLAIDNKLLTFADIELPLDEPDFWVFTDLLSYQGQTLTVRGTLLTNHLKAFQQVVLADEVPGMDDLYREALRPQYHFTPKRGWHNDANGMMYYDGEWHMFYQHNPYNWHWWNISWGHAVSTDLLHWEELPPAILPGPEGTIWSGSGAVDMNNSAGFQTGKDKTMVLAYTAWGPESFMSGIKKTQNLSYSTDRGRTWTKYKGNPVLPEKYANNRDPKILWFEPAKHWVMTVYGQTGGGKYWLHTSPDLKNWTETDVIQLGGHECPDMFELPVDGDPSNTRWVAWSGRGTYQLGSFDGKDFTSQTGDLRSYFGNAYAGQTFSNAPEGRRINIGWLRQDAEGYQAGHREMPFNQQMTLPIEFSLKTTTEGVQMFIEPVDVLKNLRYDTKQWSNLKVKAGDDPLKGIQGDQYEIQAEFDIETARAFGFMLRGRMIKYTLSTNELNCDGQKAKVVPIDGKIKLQIFLDTTSIEVFANDGRIYISRFIVFDINNHDISLFVNGGTTGLPSLKLHAMRSIWD